MAAPPSPRPFSSLDQALLEAAMGLAPLPGPVSPLAPHELPNMLPAAPAAPALQRPPSPPPASDDPPAAPRPESAVDAAKRAAEHFTRAQLRAKRRLRPDEHPAKRRKSSSSSDNDPDDLPSPSSPPPDESHRRYQKRLQKNRDSAFVSRIRRREYTRVLEETLLRVETERDTAVAAFHDMKHRLQVVTAELDGIKHGAAAHLSGLRNRLAGIMWPPPPDPAAAPLPNPRAGTATMFMFALVFGAMMPDVVTDRLGGLSLFGGRGGLSGGNAAVPAVVMAGASRTRRAHVTGNVWRVGAVGAAENRALRAELPLRQQLLATVRADAERLAVAEGARLVEAVEEYVDDLGEHEAETLFREVNAACAKGDAGVERLRRLARRVREKMREDGDEDGDGDEAVEALLGSVDCLTIADRL